MTDVRLVDFHSILNCEEKVITFCLSDPAKGIERDYSYELYDRAPMPQDNELSIHDIWLANNIGAGIEPRHFLAIWAARPRIGRALGQVPANIALTDDWAEDDGWARLRDLFEATNLKGVAYARISKILHKKRPRLIPLTDGEAVVKHRFGESERSDVAAHMVEIAQRIRQDLIANLQPMQRIQQKLWQQHGIELSLVRIMDILYWEDLKSGRARG